MFVCVCVCVYIYIYIYIYLQIFFVIGPKREKSKYFKMKRSTKTFVFS